MKNIKAIIIGGIFFIFYFLFSISLKAQVDTAADMKAMCTSLMKRTYIFEGKIDSFKYFTIQTGKYTYENYNVFLVEVTKVIKGDIHKGTIEIFQPADGIIEKGTDGVGFFQQDDGNPPPMNEGVYFCWDKGVQMRKSCFQTSNAKTIWYNEGIAAHNGVINKNPRDRFTQYFPTLSYFYSYLSANYGVKIDDK